MVKRRSDKTKGSKEKQSNFNTQKTKKLRTDFFILNACIIIINSNKQNDFLSILKAVNVTQHIKLILRDARSGRLSCKNLTKSYRISVKNVGRKRAILKTDSRIILSNGFSSLTECHGSNKQFSSQI